MEWTKTSPTQTYTPPRGESHSRHFLGGTQPGAKRSFDEVSDGTAPIDRNHHITSRQYVAAEETSAPAPWYAPGKKCLQWSVLAIYVVGAVTTAVAMHAGQCKSDRIFAQES